MATAKKKNPELWKRIVARVKSGSKGGDAGSGAGARHSLLFQNTRKQAEDTLAQRKPQASASGPSRTGAQRVVSHQAKQVNATYQKKRSSHSLLRNTQPPLEPSVRGQQKVSNSLHNRRQSLRRWPSSASRLIRNTCKICNSYLQ
jgi:hypothetical protein